MILYRFSTNPSDSDKITRKYIGNYSEVFMHEYEVVKETKCGYWIILGNLKRRFVNTESVKQYAYKSIDDAKLNYVRRKKKQLTILKSQIQEIEDSLLTIETDPELSDNHKVFRFYE